MATTTQIEYNKKRNAFERLSLIEEEVLPALVKSLNKRFQSNETKMSAIEELVDAIIGAVGVDTVTAALTESRKTRAAAQVEAEKKTIDAMKESGTLIPTDVVGPDCVVVGTESKADGTPEGPGWFSVSMNNPSVSDDNKALLMGKTIGSIGTLPSGNTFTVLEVLRIDAAKVVANAQKDE
jgi:hypothetical protein